MRSLSSRTILLLAAVLFSIGLFKLVDWTAEYLWFRALGYESVFLTIRMLKIGFFLLAFLSVLAYFWINFRIFASQTDLRAVTNVLTTQLTGRSAGPNTPFGSAGGPQLASHGSRAGTPAPLILVSVALALVFGLVFYGHWDTLLRFWWSQPFGEHDPILGRDIGFYMFEPCLSG